MGNVGVPNKALTRHHLNYMFKSDGQVDITEKVILKAEGWKRIPKGIIQEVNHSQGGDDSGNSLKECMAAAESGSLQPSYQRGWGLVGFYSEQNEQRGDTA